MLSGIGIWQLLIVLVIIILLFGTKKLRNIGSDIGGAVKGFKSAMNKSEEEKSEQDKLEQDESQTIDVTAEKKEHEPQHKKD